ncbi:MAG: nucleotide exchange factor GrpE [Chloroflexi bacterium]|nr:nucleotide exchange factor GrpE [Chloroflexota bacterium]
MAEANQTARPEPEVAGTEDIEKLKQTLAEQTARAESYLASWQRTQADFTNYKRHAEREREETTRLANAGLILNLLPVLDDMERAFASVSAAADPGWVGGFRLIERKFRAVLEAQGLSAIKAVGEPFDPNLHEAVRQDKGEEGTVIQEVQRGYQLFDKAIRPAKVVVGNGTEKEG